MAINYYLINDKDRLQIHKNNILKLFKRSFKIKLDENIWEWAYLLNPIEAPIVSLAYDENDNLLGHYAIIPFLLNYNGDMVKACLSMTTMVDPDYKNPILILELANQAYKKAKKEKFMFVFGFPNKKSKPIFSRFLNWEIEEDYVALISGKKINDNMNFNSYLKNTDKDHFSIATDHTKFYKWRLSKPSSHYKVKNNIVEKKYKDNNDIIYIKKDFKIDLSKKYNILIEGNIKDFVCKKKFDYYFGYKRLNLNKKTIKFKKDMILSDVF